MTRHVLIFACWIAVIGTGAFLRFDQLSKRPFHADEATGARLAASRMESGSYRFDPLHYHGPTLSSFSIPLLTIAHQNLWQEMTKTTPRLLTAVAGTLLLLVPLGWRRRFGDPAMLLASALLATSPLLVYYSRMYIHEPLLVLFGLLAVVSLKIAPRYGLPGLWIGLMFATKESFAISIIAWSGAAILMGLENRKRLDRTWWVAAWRDYRIPVFTSLLTATGISMFLYTDGFRHPWGAIDSVRTFFVYETVAGHDKPFGYYFHLLAVPFRSGGVWWFGTPVVILALVAFASTFQRDGQARGTIRFLAYAAIGHLLIYSCFAYKTPWLACLPWAHVCLLAGFGIRSFSSSKTWLKSALVLLAVAAVVSQFYQARHATGRFASDERNPFAYVPTRPEIETLQPWLGKLQQVAAAKSLEPVAVLGADYWPLPWYLRSFDQIGYWPSPTTAGWERFPLVFAMPEVEEAVAGKLRLTHVPLPRGLRAAVPVTLFVRNDIWNSWMRSENKPNP